jgi:transposase/IS5 family transposase
MRGKEQLQTEAIHLINVENQLRSTHPLREVKRMCKEVLKEMEPFFAQMYAVKGRPSIPPERMLMAWVLMCLFGVRSCRRFSEDLQFNLLYKWFLDMNPDEDAFDASSFSKNMERFKTGHVSELFFAQVVELAKARGWVSDEHFSVDGTLIEAWASIKSFRPKDEDQKPPENGGRGNNGWVDFKGEKRSNDTHESTTDPEAKLIKHSEGDAAKLRYAMHAVSENRNGLLVLLDVKQAVGERCAEHEAASDQLDELTLRGFNVTTVGADKGYHTKEFVQDCRDRQIAPHVAMVKGRKTPGLDGRTARSAAYQMSQRLRKRIEENFGWMKAFGNFRKSRWIGAEKTHFVAQFVGSACNLIRMAKLSLAEANLPLQPAAA